MSSLRPDQSQIQRYLACVGEPSRFRLLIALASGERCVTELAHDVGLSQSCTTRHLQAMREAGVVDSIRRGKQVCFRIIGGEGTGHPVLRWVLGSEAGNGGESSARAAEAGVEVEVLRARPAGAAGEDGGTYRARRQRHTTPAAADAETFLAAEHESGWASDGPAPDGRSDSNASANGDRDVETDIPQFRRDLDDFLL